MQMKVHPMRNSIEMNVDSAIRNMSGSLSPEDISRRLPDSITGGKSSKRLRSSFIKVLRMYKERKNYGHLATGILTALIVEGTKFIYELESNGLLLSSERVERKHYEMLKRLMNCTGESQIDGNLLAIRIQTYMNYCELLLTAENKISDLNALLRNRSEYLVKALLGLAELAFFERSLIGEPLIDEPSVQRLLSIFRSPEELTSMISLLVWRANENKPLVDEEFQGRIDKGITSIELMEAIDCGILLHEINEIAKAISCFGYKMVREKKSKSIIFCLHPPDSNFECYLRLGYIRDEMMRPTRKIRVSSAVQDPLLSMVTATEYLLEKYESTLSEWANEPFPRVRTLIPMSLPFDSLLEKNFYYEDAQYAELLRDEYLLMDSLEDVPMAKGLNLKTFMKVWRSLYFFSTLNANAIKLYKTKYNKMTSNSLVRVAIEEKYLSNIAQALKLDESELRRYVHLISWDANKRGYLDIQYQPYLKVGSLLIYLPAISMASNIFRNTQVSNKIRIEGRGNKFTELCKNTIKKQFNNVVSERKLKIKAKGQFTEVDVVAWHDDTIYLFECKYSLPPCDYHEMRDIWEEIQKGVQQLKVAELILNDPFYRQNYLTGWFPGTSENETKNLIIKSCIIISHRLFAGMDINGVPIRDIYSFNSLLTEGIMSYGFITPDEESTIIQYSPVSDKGFVSADLDEYLGKDAKLFKTFTHNMCRVTHLDYVDYEGELILARETYLHYERKDTSYYDHIEMMDGLGFRRLPDKKMKTKSLMDLESFKAILNDRERVLEHHEDA